MAVTSIWAVHGSVKDLIDYAENPEKTENPHTDELKKLMTYAENPDKTEKRYFVSGVNCLPELAYERMTATKKRYGKCNGIVAYHAYQSFKPGEVTPDECHKLGVELAKRLWGIGLRSLWQVIAIMTICTIILSSIALASRTA